MSRKRWHPVSAFPGYLRGQSLCITQPGLFRPPRAYATVCRYRHSKVISRGGRTGATVLLSLCTYNFPMYEDQGGPAGRGCVRRASMRGEKHMDEDRRRRNMRQRPWRGTERGGKRYVPSVLCRKRGTEGAAGAKGYQRNIGTPNGNRYHIYLSRCIFNHPARFSERSPLIKLLTSLEPSRRFVLSFCVFFRPLVSRPFLLSILRPALREPNGSAFTTEIRSLRHP